MMKEFLRENGFEEIANAIKIIFICCVYFPRSVDSRYVKSEVDLH